MAGIKIGHMTLGVCATNCYFLYREGASEAVLIDPADRGADLYEGLKKKGFFVTAILLTHGHFDHIGGAEQLRRLSGAKLYAPLEEKALCMDPYANLSLQFGSKTVVEADQWLSDGQKLTLAGIDFLVISTPGHTAGSTCYYVEKAKILLAGDTLFAGSVGRTDFPTGSMGKLVRSVKEKLFVLPDGTKVYPGHGEYTTIGEEKEYNPYCQ